MSRFDALRHRLSVLLRSRHYARELEAERRFHLELEAMQQRHTGLDAIEAHFAARRKFGNVTYFGEETRRMTRLPFVDSLAQDLRYAVRTLRKSPGFALAVILTLALGIGANTAIFSVVNHLLLHPLPYKDADRMVFLWESGTQGDFDVRFAPTLDVIHAWKSQARTLEAIESYTSHLFLATSNGETRLVNGLAITPGLPAFLDARPILGRGFVPADTEPGAPPVVLISEASWRQDYGSSAGVLGRTITLDGTTYTIVGVMPARWDVLSLANANAERLWLPLSLNASNDTARMVGANTVARLRIGVTPDVARRELNTIFSRLAGAKTFGTMKLTTSVMRPQQDIRGDVSRTALLVMLAAVGLVLLVACANVANLLLARATARAREIALRTALGASRWRLTRQVLTESMVLAVLGGSLGVLIAWCGLHLIMALRPERLTELAGVRLDPFVLEFTLALSVLTGVLFGLVPALQTTSLEQGRVLRSGASGVVRTGSGRRFRAVLVAAEMALSVVLLVGAGLLVRSVIHLQHTDAGFDAHNLFSVELSLPRGAYAQPADRELFTQHMLDGLHRMPGVAGATQASRTLTGYGYTFSALQIAGRTLSDADRQTPIEVNSVQPDYFHAVGIRLLHGRTFTADEMRTGHAVIINAAMARRFWPNEPAVGKEIKVGTHDTTWIPVVGVVSDVAANGLTEGIHDPQMYSPYREAEAPVIPARPPRLLFIVRSASDPAPVIARIRQLTRSIDPGVAIAEVSSVEAQLASSIAGPRFNMVLLTVFAAIALLLAAVGLAAVVGYAVTERTHEIGIRMALGARETNVMRLVITQGMRAVVAGLVLGAIGALAATRLLSSMLYGVEARDPLTFACVTVLLFVVALVASWLPARRATRVDPIIALRAE